MDIISLNEFVKFDNRLDMYNMIDPTVIYIPNGVGAITYTEFLVEEHHEMRVDLLFRDMYDLEANEVGIYLGNIDIICLVNDIDNPINIIRGMILIYPRMEDFSSFRVNSDTFTNKEDVRSKLVVRNKSTRKDKDRQKFKDNGYSLSPVILDKPKPPVRIKNGKFSVGGL